MIVETIGAFLAVLSFSFLLELPRKFVAGAGAVGGIGWLVYLILEQYAGSVILAAFGSSLVIALISHLFARLLKAPVTVFLVAGILPSVPGGSIYRCVYYIIQNDETLSTFYFVETLQIAGSIAMAIFIMDSLFQLGKQKKRS